MDTLQELKQEAVIAKADQERLQAERSEWRRVNAAVVKQLVCPRCLFFVVCMSVSPCRCVPVLNLLNFVTEDTTSKNGAKRKKRPKVKWMRVPKWL